MRLFVIRHATAEEAGARPDADRRLTERGRQEAMRTGRALRRLESSVGAILSSPAVRAVETARLISESFDPHVEVELCEALWGSGGAKGILEALRGHGARDRMAIVGHQPYLGNLVALLTGGEEGAVPFRPSAVCCLETGDGDLSSARVLWRRGPEELAEAAESR